MPFLSLLLLRIELRNSTDQVVVGYAQGARSTWMLFISRDSSSRMPFQGQILTGILVSREQQQHLFPALKIKVVFPYCPKKQPHVVFFFNCCCLLSYGYPSQQLQLPQQQFGSKSCSLRKFCSLRHQLFQNNRNLSKSLSP